MAWKEKGRGIPCGCGCSAGPPAVDALSSKWSLLFLLQQDVDTAIVSDTTDDLWFLNESPLDQTNTAVKMETADCEEVKEGDKKVPFQAGTTCVCHQLASMKCRILCFSPAFQCCVNM